jgi:hypothetical protein
VLFLQFAYLGITFAISFRPVFHLNWSFPLIVITLVRATLAAADHPTQPL